MALVVYDQGYRIQTPVHALFKPRGTEELTASRAMPPLPSSDDVARDEAKQLEQLFRRPPEHASQQRLPSASSEPEPTLPDHMRRYLGQERRKVGLTAKQLMVTPVYTVREQTSLRAAWSQMLTHAIHHLVVIDDTGGILGMLSDSDFVEHGPDSPVAVAQAYQRKIIVASEDTELSLLASSFVNYPLRALPVIDAEEKLVGIITRSDLLRLLINNARVESWA